MWAGGEGCAELPCTEVQVMHCTTLGDAPFVWTMTIHMALGMCGRCSDFSVPWGAS